MDMQLNGVRPDLATFNAVLYSLSRMVTFRRAPNLALQTLTEMKNVGIEPSLASWKYLLAVFYPNESSDSNMLYKVMDELEGREFELRHVDDVEFFVNAMKICCQNLHDVELAFRVDELLNTGDNAALLGDSRLVNIYYSFFLRLVFTFETLDTIMDVYQRVTPHLWTPNLTVLEELLKAIELQDGYRHLPLIWTDLLLFEFLRREDLLERLLQLMAKQKQEPDLQRQYAHIAGQLIQRWNEEREAGRDPVLSTGHMVSHILAIAENAGDHDLAWTMFDIYRKNKNAFSGTPTDSSLQRLVSGCLERGDGERAVAVVNFMNTLDMAGVGDVAQSVLDSDKVALTEQQREILASL
ncbi:hypothetical protein BaRGS_00024309 [Batillaria attramentaria]|uniref:Small ribosomal subunit protein mS39 n=1 Tax=Batillaria attramentaria TaxID=370345 RepID=A0ABD0KBH1_9CAEN